MSCLNLIPPRALRASPAGPWRRARGLAACLTALACGGLALAAGTPPAPPAQAAPAGEADLAQRARAWLAATHRVDASAIGVQALDARVQVRPCVSGWQFDQPFTNNDAVLRARCANPTWQVFLTVVMPARPVAAAATANPGTPATLAMATTGTPPAPAPVLQPAAYGMQPPAAIPLPAVPQPAAPLLVRRGHTVVTTWTPVPGLVVSARLEALDDGRMGDIIRLRNRDSGRVLSALVSGQNQALGQ